MNTARPPRWAEAFLRTLLPPRDKESVTGDLLEEYRERALPQRGRAGAHLWYLRQVAGFLVRANGVWAVMLGLAFVGRTALDWFLPTTDFHTRSLVSTILSAGVLLCAGFVASWRSETVRSGAIAGAWTAILGAGVSLVGDAALLAVSHDRQTFAAIEGSGGLGEVFTLPILLVVPALLLGTLGGLCGRVSRRIVARS